MVMDVIKWIKVSSRAQDISGGEKRLRTFLVQNTILLVTLAAQVSVSVALLRVPLASQARCLWCFSDGFSHSWEVASSSTTDSWLEGCRRLDHLKSPFAFLVELFHRGPSRLLTPDACVRRDFGLDFGWKAESDSYWSRCLWKQLCSIFWIVLFLGKRNRSVIDGALLTTVVS